jgi:hypothetical protein
MVRRRDEHHIEIFFRKHLPVVAVGARFLFGGLPAGDLFGGVGEHEFVHVAKRNDFDGCDLDEAQQVGLSVPAASDEPDAFSLIGEIHGEAAEVGSREERGAAAEERAAVHARGNCQSHGGMATRVEMGLGHSSACGEGRRCFFLFHGVPHQKRPSGA